LEIPLFGEAPDQIGIGVNSDNPERIRQAMRRSVDEIFEIANDLKQMATSCRFCPRKCQVDRSTGERGFCGGVWLPTISGATRHFGEEPPLVGEWGAGTIFFANCNLRCVFCQNHQISRGLIGSEFSISQLAGEMIRLQDEGAMNIEPVSPTHEVHAFVEALGLASSKGLKLPTVYNCGGYESLDVIRLLDGVVDVYLPDLKYAENEAALRYSNCEDYVEHARMAIREMYLQVGDLKLDERGLAAQGLIIRHLVLPEDASGTLDTLQWIKSNLSTEVTISLMAQYSPLYEACNFGEINRRINQDEYDRIVDECWRLGFENVFVQDFESQDVGIPDFREKEPFTWVG
jgi:putative pyruvate formate lyase activating enzyme